MQSKNQCFKTKTKYKQTKFAMSSDKMWYTCFRLLLWFILAFKLETSYDLISLQWKR